eukprot:SAG22_NODE_606_length_8615_cov_6.190348_13_plen_61_part_00
MVRSHDTPLAVLGGRAYRASAAALEDGCTKVVIGNGHLSIQNHTALGTCQKGECCTAVNI